LLAWALPLALASGASAAHWSVMHEKSSLGFAGAAGGTPFAGRFARWEAQIDFDPGDAARGQVEVLVDTASAETGDSERDTTLPQPAWFNVKVFPRAKLTVQSFRPKGGDDYDAVGTLEMRGVQMPIVMPVKIEVAGATLHATGRLDIKRTDYGVGEGVGAQWVALGVAASFDVTATRVP
jgi:polyisoprenoid-binding protein YceI